jgi:3-deoxy-D-manno-octulosonic-acid transferase
LSAAAAIAILRRTINATRLIYFLYQVLQLALLPALALYLLYRGIRDPRYFAGLKERLGFLSRSFETTGAESIWFHAVSVGEILSSVELLRRLRAERPRVSIYVSTATLAGRALADQKLAGMARGVFFAPLDYRSAVRRVLRRLRPALVVVLETEIWPNLFRESKKAGAALILINGRISDRAGPSYRRWRGFFQHVLRWPDQILVQTEEDGRRYVAAGAPPDRMKIGGNLKYDFAPPAKGVAPEIAQFLDSVHPDKVWIAASTMPPMTAGDPDEDDAVIAAFSALKHTGLLLILAPRRPERFDAVAEKLAHAGVSFVRRSRLNGPADVLVLDSIGELAALFERADVVFMGGTLAQRGGHNILEPAYFGRPVIVGPHMENFAEIAAEFHEADALERIDEAAQLAGAVARLLDDSSRAKAIGCRARDLAMAKRGVAAGIAKEIWHAYADGVPEPPHRLAARVALTPLSWAWRAGHRLNLARGMAARRALSTPVVSIGGLTMGGAGKTPMVAHLAARLREMGRNPAILTRGYKTGDEAQMLLRAGDARVGIGGDRFSVGRQLEQERKPDVFLLDDGFQHVRLDRQHDVVLIDALDPLGGGVFPLGRLREPLDNLKRATEIVITRVEPGQSTAGLERRLRRYNAEAALFRSRVVPRQWVELDTGAAIEIAAAAFRRVAAFCGLAVPRAFWRTLEELGLECAFQQAFGDHHRYRPEELRRLADRAAAGGAEALVTTEKDAINLPEGAAALVAPLKLRWLRIGIEIENEEEFLKRIL